MNFDEPRYIPFLLAVLALYYLLPQRGRLVLLLAASYAFYSAWKPAYALLILASTVLDYTLSLAIERSSDSARRTRLLLLSLAGNLGLLFYFKYTGFALDNFNRILNWLELPAMHPEFLRVALPIGISFYTFQTLSYTIDVYRRRFPAQRDFVLVAAYVSFFPQLVAGPIERAHHLMPQLRMRHAWNWENIRAGGRLILWGLVKKAVISDRCRELGFEVYRYPAMFHPAAVLVSIFILVWMVYLDFSAYTDIARGSARLFGINLTLNFRNPYMARNIADLWSRWHMSLTTWVADYLHRPLLRRLPRTLAGFSAATFITMLLVGIWHGADENFALWGALHGVLLVAHYYYRRFSRRLLPVSSAPSRLRVLVEIVSTQFLWGISNVLFFASASFGGVSHAVNVYKALFNFSRPMDLNSLLYVATWGPIVLAMYLLNYGYMSRNPLRNFDRWHPALRALVYIAAFYLLWFASVANSAEFIYFQF